jgi:hypothetical protein
MRSEQRRYGRLLAEAAQPASDVPTKKGPNAADGRLGRLGGWAAGRLGGWAAGRLGGC